MNKIVGETFGLLALVIGVAILAVIVSNRSNTANVVTAGGNAFANILTAAMSPVTGASANIGRGSGLGVSAF